MTDSLPAAEAADAAQADRQFTISDLAQEFEVTARAIRFYEDKGLLTPHRDGQRRVFNQRDRTRLKLILRGKRLGFSLREIQEILDLYSTDLGQSRQLAHFQGKLAERRASLMRQREDIDLTLAEIARIEQQCRDLLGED